MASRPAADPVDVSSDEEEVVTTRRFSNAGTTSTLSSPMQVSAPHQRGDPGSGGSRSTIRSVRTSDYGVHMNRSASMPAHRWPAPNLRPAASFTLTSSTGKPLTSLTSKVVNTPKAAGPVSVRGRRLSVAAPGRRLSGGRGSGNSKSSRAFGPSPLRPSPLHVHGSAQSLASSSDGSYGSLVQSPARSSSAAPRSPARGSPKQAGAARASGVRHQAPRRVSSLSSLSSPRRASLLHVFSASNLPPSAQRALDVLPEDGDANIDQLEATAKTCVDELGAAVQLGDHYAEELFHARSLLNKQGIEIQRLRTELTLMESTMGTETVRTVVHREHMHHADGPRQEFLSPIDVPSGHESQGTGTTPAMSPNVRQGSSNGMSYGGSGEMYMSGGPSDTEATPASIGRRESSMSVLSGSPAPRRDVEQLVARVKELEDALSNSEAGREALQLAMDEREVWWKARINAMRDEHKAMEDELNVTVTAADVPQDDDESRPLNARVQLMADELKRVQAARRKAQAALRSAEERVGELETELRSASTSKEGEVRRLTLDLKRLKRAQGTESAAKSREAAKSKRLLALQLQKTEELQAAYDAAEAVHQKHEQQQAAAALVEVVATKRAYRDLHVAFNRWREAVAPKEAAPVAADDKAAAGAGAGAGAGAADADDDDAASTTSSDSTTSMSEYGDNAVMISYCRRNSEFVNKLHAAFKAKGVDVWIDFEDIPKGVDWWESIKSGIERAQVCVFCLSNESIKSTVCGWELDHMMKHNKKVLPIVVADDFNWDDVRPDIAKLNFIFFSRPQDDFDQSFAELCEAIRTDHGYIELHTRFNVWAVEWQQHQRDPALLFGGSYLKVVEGFLDKARTRKPAPSDYMREFFEASFEQHEADLELKRKLAEAEEALRLAHARAESMDDTAAQKALADAERKAAQVKAANEAALAAAHRRAEAAHKRAEEADAEAKEKLAEAAEQLRLAQEAAAKAGASDAAAQEALRQAELQARKLQERAEAADAAAAAAADKAKAEAAEEMHRKLAEADAAARAQLAAAEEKAAAMQRQVEEAMAAARAAANAADTDAQARLQKAAEEMRIASEAAQAKLRAAEAAATEAAARARADAEREAEAKAKAAAEEAERQAHVRAVAAAEAAQLEAQRQAAAAEREARERLELERRAAKAAAKAEAKAEAAKAARGQSKEAQRLHTAVTMCERMLVMSERHSAQRALHWWRLTTVRETLMQQLAAEQQRVAKLASDVNQALQERNASRAELQEAGAKHVEAERQIQAALEELKEERQTVAGLRAQLASANQACRAAEEATAAKAEAAKAAEGQSKEAQRLHTAVTTCERMLVMSQRHSAQRALHWWRLTTVREALMQQLATEQQHVAKLASDVNQALQERNASRAELQEAGEKHEEAERQIQAAAKDLKEERQTVAGLRAQLASANQACRAAQEATAAAKASLAAAEASGEEQSAELTRLRGVVESLQADALNLRRLMNVAEEQRDQAVVDAEEQAARLKQAAREEVELAVRRTRAGATMERAARRVRLNGVWQAWVAWRRYNAEVVAAQREAEAEERLEAVRRQAEEVQGEAKHLRDDLEAAQRRMAELSEGKAAVEAGLMTEAERLREEMEASRQRESQLAKSKADAEAGLQSQARELASQAEKLRADLEAAREREAQMEKGKAAVEADLGGEAQRLRAQLGELRREQSRLKAEVKGLRASLATAHERRDNLAAARDKHANRAKALEGEKAAAEAAAKTAAEEAAGLAKEVSEGQATVRDLRKELHATQANLRTMGDQVKLLQEAVQAATADRDRVAAEGEQQATRMQQQHVEEVAAAVKRARVAMAMERAVRRLLHGRVWQAWRAWTGAVAAMRRAEREAELQSALLQQKRAAAALQDEASAVKERLEAAEARCEELERERDRAREFAADLTAQSQATVGDKDATIKSLREALHAAQDNAAELERGLAATRAELDDVSAARSAAVADAGAQRTRADAAESSVESLAARVKQLEAELAESESVCASQSENLRTLTADVTQLQTLVKELRAQAAALDAKLAAEAAREQALREQYSEERAEQAKRLEAAAAEAAAVAAAAADERERAAQEAAEAKARAVKQARGAMTVERVVRRVQHMSLWRGMQAWRAWVVRDRQREHEANSSSAVAEEAARAKAALAHATAAANDKVAAATAETRIKAKALKAANTRIKELEAQLVAANSKLAKNRAGRQADAANFKQTKAALEAELAEARRALAAAERDLAAERAVPEPEPLATPAMPVPRASFSNGAVGVHFERAAAGSSPGPTAGSGGAHKRSGAAGAGNGAGAGGSTASTATGGTGAGQSQSGSSPAAVPYPLVVGSVVVVPVPEPARALVINEVSLDLAVAAGRGKKGDDTAAPAAVHVDALDIESGTWKALGVGTVAPAADPSAGGSRRRGPGKGRRQTVTLRPLPGSACRASALRITVGDAAGPGTVVTAPLPAKRRAAGGDAPEQVHPLLDALWKLHGAKVEVGEPEATPTPVPAPEVKGAGEVEVTETEEFPFWRLVALGLLFLILCAAALVMVWITGSRGCLCLHPRLVTFPTHVPT